MMKVTVKLTCLRLKQSYANILKYKGQEFKCDKCAFFGKTELFIKKHKNTKHPLQNIEEKGSLIKVDCTLEGIEDFEDLFQL